MAARHENNYLQTKYVIVYRKGKTVCSLYVLLLHVGQHLCLLSFMVAIKAVAENLFHLYQSTAKLKHSNRVKTVH